MKEYLEYLNRRDQELSHSANTGGKVDLEMDYANQDEKRRKRRKNQQIQPPSSAGIVRGQGQAVQMAKDDHDQGALS